MLGEHRPGAGAGARAQVQGAGAGQFGDRGEGTPCGCAGGGGRRGEPGGQLQGVVQPLPHPGQLGRAPAGGRGREVAGGSKVHVVVEEFDDGDGPAGPGTLLDGLTAPRHVEGGPRVEHRAPHRRPVQPVAARRRARGLGVRRVDEEQFRRRGLFGVRLAQHPDVERDAVRGRGAGRERDDGAEGAATQQVGADPPPRAAGGGGRGHQHDGGAALAEVGEGVLDPGELGLGAGGEAVLPARVVGQFVVAPVALVERRMAEDRVHGEPGERVGAQGVAGPDGERGPVGPAPRRVQGEAEGGERRQVGVGLLRVQGRRAADGAQQGAGPGGGVEDRA